MSDEMYTVKARVLGNVYIEHYVCFYTENGQAAQYEGIIVEAAKLRVSLEFDEVVGIDANIPYILGDSSSEIFTAYREALGYVARLLGEADPFNAFMKY